MSYSKVINRESVLNEVVDEIEQLLEKSNKSKCKKVDVISSILDEDEIKCIKKYNKEFKFATFLPNTTSYKKLDSIMDGSIDKNIKCINCDFSHDQYIDSYKTIWYRAR